MGRRHCAAGPAVVNPETTYREAWTRSQKLIRELIPSRRSKIIIAIEEVWNKFLLSPLEFARYIDEFESPWVGAYFDVGNVVYGYPQEWIRELGKRIVKIHIKEFTPSRRATVGYKLGEEGARSTGRSVRQALTEVGYEGYVTTEIEGGDLAYLKDVSARVDRFIAGEKPVAVSPSAATGKKLGEIGWRRRLQLDSAAIVRVPEPEAPGVQRMT